MALSLTFDDGRRSQWQYGVPLLNMFNVKATFYALPKALELHPGEWKAVAEAGHEIGNHTLTHPCSGNFSFARKNPLETYDLQTMALELDNASSRIQDLLGVQPQTFAYPCGQKFVGRGRCVASYVPLVAEKFIAGRGWRDEGHNVPKFCDLAQLFAVSLDVIDFDTACAYIERALQEKGWLIFAGHDVGEKAVHGQIVLEDTLRRICEYVLRDKKEVWIDTLATIAKYIKTLREDTS